MNDNSEPLSKEVNLDEVAPSEKKMSDEAIHTFMDSSAKAGDEAKFETKLEKLFKKLGADVLSDVHTERWSKLGGRKIADVLHKFRLKTQPKGAAKSMSHTSAPLKRDDIFTKQPPAPPAPPPPRKQSTPMHFPRSEFAGGGGTQERYKTTQQTYEEVMRERAEMEAERLLKRKQEEDRIRNLTRGLW